MSVPFIVESLEQTNFDSPLTLADVEFLPTQQTSPKRAKVPLLLCAFQVAYFIISCCDLNHLPPPSLSTDGNNYRLQFFFSGDKLANACFFWVVAVVSSSSKSTKKGTSPFLYPGVYEVTSPMQSDKFCCYTTPVKANISPEKIQWLEDDMSWGTGPMAPATSPSTQSNLTTGTEPRLGKLEFATFTAFLEEVFQGRHGGLHKGLQRRPPLVGNPHSDHTPKSK